MLFRAYFTPPEHISPRRSPAAPPPLPRRHTLPVSPRLSPSLPVSPHPVILADRNLPDRNASRAAAAPSLFRLLHDSVLFSSPAFHSPASFHSCPSPSFILQPPASSSAFHSLSFSHLPLPLPPLTPFHSPPLPLPLPPFTPFHPPTFRFLFRLSLPFILPPPASSSASHSLSFSPSPASSSTFHSLSSSHLPLPLPPLTPFHSPPPSTSSSTFHSLSFSPSPASSSAFHSLSSFHLPLPLPPLTPFHSPTSRFLFHLFKPFHLQLFLSPFTPLCPRLRLPLFLRRTGTGSALSLSPD